MAYSECRMQRCRSLGGISDRIEMIYHFDFAFLADVWPEFVLGAFLALKLTYGANIRDMAFGTLIATRRTAGSRWIRRLVMVYVQSIRNTPLLIQMFWLF